MSQLANVIESAADLHRELTKRGLELRPNLGRDVVLMQELSDKLGIPGNRLITNLKASGKTAEDYLRAFIEVAQPFAQMFRDIWAYLAKYAAPKANESLRIRFGFDEVVDIDLELFREMAETAEEFFIRAPVLHWPSELIFRLCKILLEGASDWRGGRAYQPGDLFRMPVLAGSREAEELVRRVCSTIQSLIDEVAPTWRARKEALSARDIVYDAIWKPACLLTDLVPVWSGIVSHWDSISEDAKEEAVEYFNTQGQEQLKLVKQTVLRKVQQALDILKMPFWQHRWHTYEIWATTRALNSLAEYHPRPVVENGYLALDAAKTTLVAQFSKNCLFAHVQGKTSAPAKAKSRRHIMPDLRFGTADPPSPHTTIAIVEYKQRRVLDISHIHDVCADYTHDSAVFGGVVLINYDAIDTTPSVPGCSVIANVQPRFPAAVALFEQEVRKCFVRASIKAPAATTVVLLDTSGSMGSRYDPVMATLKVIRRLPGVHVCQFGDSLGEIGDFDVTGSIPTGGGTDLEESLAQLFVDDRFADLTRLLIVSDGEHDDATALLKRLSDYRECTPAELPMQVDWLTEDAS